MTTPSTTLLSVDEAREVRSSRVGDDLPNLDFLRSVAVLLVVFGHLTYFHGLTALGPLYIYAMGSLGVKIFFVHTCFVLMLSLERQWRQQGGSALFVSFMIRRIFRIYPLSVMTVLLAVAFRLPLAELQPSHFLGAVTHLRTVVTNLLLLQRLGPGHEPSIIGPMWSLPYEMAMYLVLPCLFLFLYPTTSVLRVAGLWSISILACLALLLHPARMDNFFVLFIPCFLPGVIAYQIQRIQRPQLPAFLWPGAVMALVIPSLHKYKQSGTSEDWIRGWILCLALGLAVPFFGQISARWLTVPSKILAKYSYGIYLVHFFCIWFAFDRLHFLLPRMARLALFVVLVSGLSVLFYHFLEEPMVVMGKRIAKRAELIWIHRLQALAVPEYAGKNSRLSND